MTPTKDQQAQEYAEKFPPIPSDDIAYAIGCAWLDGYTACEQSMWRSVEEELPEEFQTVIAADFANYGTRFFLMHQCLYKDGKFIDEEWNLEREVSHWMQITPPSLPDTNTEKI